MRQAELDEIKNSGRDLVEAPNTGDKNELRETLADVQGKWHDLTELLVQMISFAVSTCCEQQQIYLYILYLYGNKDPYKDHVGWVYSH